MTIGNYLLQKLQQFNVRHIFAVPGDYVLKFCGLIEKSPIKYIGMTREDAAGYAADAYARLNGMGALCVTYGVGGLSAVNSMAGAYAEKSPVVIISGAPGLKEREKNLLLHHRVGDFLTPKRIYEEITADTALLDKPERAFDEIDRIFEAAYRCKRPGYIELPRDMVDIKGGFFDARSVFSSSSKDTENLLVVVQEIVNLINKSANPVIVAGMEIQRFGLQDALLKIIEKTNIPIATTLMGKSVISEDHPFHLGVYAGAIGCQEARDFVEKSDCVIVFGAIMTDANLGMYTADLKKNHLIDVRGDEVIINNHRYQDVVLRDFLEALLASPSLKRKFLSKRKISALKFSAKPVQIKPKAPITISRLFEILNDFITEKMIVVADVGDSLFGAINLKTKKPNGFLASVYYASMGFAMPASISSQLVKPDHRVLVLVGDGAFQMTGLELSTTVRLGLNPIVILLNNRGYGTQRQVQEGGFNDIGVWCYEQLPDLLGAGKHFAVSTETELAAALKKAFNYKESFTIIEVKLSKLDCSVALKQLAQQTSKSNACKKNKKL